MTGVWEWLFGNQPIEWIQQLFGLGHPLPFRIFSLLGDTWGVILVAGLAFWLFGRRALHAVLGMVIVATALRLGIASVVGQTRPTGPEIVSYQDLESGSFPSGHIMQAVGPWGVLYALGWLPLWTPVLAVVLVALGRLYLGTHYVGDVLGAVVLGSLLVWLYARLWPGVYAWLRKRGTAIQLTFAGVAAAGTLAWMVVMGGNARRYEVYGVILGLSVALPLEHHLIRFRPGPRLWTHGAARVLIGLAGIVLCLLWDRSQTADARLLGTLTAGLATLWAVLGAPALFRATGLEGEAGRSPTVEHGRRTNPGVK